MKKTILMLSQIWLAIIAAVIVICLAMGWMTWGWVIAYWILLTFKNVVELI